MNLQRYHIKMPSITAEIEILIGLIIGSYQEAM